MIDRLSYFWGLFDSAEVASVEDADKHVHFEASAMPEAVSRSFEAGEIAGLEGDFGVSGVGDPTEIDHLEYSAGGKTSQIRVVNRGISMFTAETPELVRLHRFFCVVQREM